MKKQRLNVPRFKSEDQERAFWSRMDLSRYFSARDFETIAFPNLKPSSRSISVRMPEFLLIRLKEQANELRIPYQSLLKRYVAQGVLKKR